MNKQAFKILLSVGCIVIGIIIGSFIKWGGGNAALIGAVVGLILYAMISWLLSQWKRRVHSESNSWQQTGIGDQQQVDTVAKKMQVALQQEQIRHRPPER